MAKIDYYLRPAKYIVRRMLVDAFRRLGPFGAVQSYRYIGFGALQFRDFAIVHRDLGITDMLSIERDTSCKERYEFNRPFACVRHAFAEASAVLPSLPWDRRTILWLDYESRLNRAALGDIGMFAQSASPGSVLVVTVNATADLPADDPLGRLKELLGDENVPADVTGKSLSGWGLAETSLRIINNKLGETIATRNGGLPDLIKLEFQQLFNFQYDDGARMLTAGGVVHERAQKAILDTCAFDQLGFTRNDHNAYTVDVPRLTFKELRFLDSQLPSDAGVKVDGRGVPETDLARYEQLYRYFPVFAVADL